MRRQGPGTELSSIVTTWLTPHIGFFLLRMLTKLHNWKHLEIFLLNRKMNRGILCYSFRKSYAKTRRSWLSDQFFKSMVNKIEGRLQIVLNNVCRSAKLFQGILVKKNSVPKLNLDYVEKCDY
jgi:hypothetical protein